MRIFLKLLLTFFIVCAFGEQLHAQGITKEEVVFKSGDSVLEGTLVLPDSAKNVPVLIFMGGTYPWGDFYPQRAIFIQEILEAVFPESGIALLYYDPRGVGGSTGSWGRATMSDFADDAIAAIHFLRQRKEINSNRIGIVGLGEAGWVAQIVGATVPDKVKMMASLAGPLFGSQTELINEYHSAYVCSGMDSTKAYKKAEQKAISHQNWVSIIALTSRWKHMQSKLGFTPKPYIKNLEVPSLFLFGQNDADLYPSWAMDSLQTIFPDSLPPNFSVYTIAGANHFFQIANRCYNYEESNSSIQKSFSFRFKEILRNWIFEHL
jgi:pimeloyl-ACP methyl ester carboxylesterase